MSIQTPNMNLYLPTIGVDSGLTWKQQINANSSILDGHNHSAGSGTQINPSGLNLNADLPFNGNNATLLKSSRYSVQASPLAGASDLGCVYVSGVDLYFNDVNGNQIPITSGGLVNATSSGISSGTASASFSASTLVVVAASNTPANLKCASVLLGNTGVSGSHYCTLSPPSSLAANYALQLPPIPAQTNVMSLDTSGNMASITYDQVGVSMTVVGADAIAASMDATGANAIGSVMGQSGANAILAASSNANLPGTAVEAGSKHVVVSQTNATLSLAMIRGTVDGNASVLVGEGFTAALLTTGVININFTTSFSDTPAMVVSASSASVIAVVTTVSVASATVRTNTTSASPTAVGFSFIAIGQRA